VPGRRIVLGRCCVRLHRDAGDALHPSVEANDVSGALESRCGRGLVSNLNVDAEIIRRMIPEARDARLYRVGSPNYRRQRLISDLDQLGRVPGLIDGLGHDHGDGFADKAGPIVRHRVIEGRDRAEASKPCGNIRGPHQSSTVRDRREPVGDIVLAYEHCEHTWRRERYCLVDGCDVRMSVRRAHNHGMRQLRQTDVVGEAASAGEETKILLAPHRLTNAVRHVAR